MSDETLQAVAKRIAAVRKRQALTQAAVAKKAGIEVNTYARVERGQMNPSTTQLLKIIEALGVPSKDVLGN